MIGYALHRRIGEAVGGFALASLLEAVVVVAALMVIGAAGVAPDHATRFPSRGRRCSWCC
jgi:hypothetical protein